MVFLVILLGAVHGLFLLPVLLSIFGPGSCSKNEKKRLKTPASSYLSDTLPSKDKRKGHMFDFPEAGLRIPRPATTISLSTATPTDIDTSESSPGSAQTSNRTSAGTEKQFEANGNAHRRGRQLHEMYHNNGYLSEEDLEDASNTWRSNPRGGGIGGVGGGVGGGAASNKLINFNNYPPYAYPSDSQPSFGPNVSDYLGGGRDEDMGRRDYREEDLGRRDHKSSHHHRHHSKSRKRDITAASSSTTTTRHSREGSSTSIHQSHSRSRDLVGGGGGGSGSGGSAERRHHHEGHHSRGQHHSGHTRSSNSNGSSHCKRSKSKEHVSRRDK